MTTIYMQDHIGERGRCKFTIKKESSYLKMEFKSPYLKNYIVAVYAPTWEVGSESPSITNFKATKSSSGSYTYSQSLSKFSRNKVYTVHVYYYYGSSNSNIVYLDEVVFRLQ